MSSPTPNVPIPASHKELFTTLSHFVKDYMSKYDMSHDYQHILRVLSNAHRILLSEQKAHPETIYDPTTIYFAALLHDVGDKKYAKPGEDVGQIVYNVLKDRGADAEFAHKIQTIVTHVSYTNEVTNPQSVTDVLATYPELAVVQDADRLDAIGAIGVARCFAFSGAKRQGEEMGVAIQHFGEKLLRLPGMMKTGTGREMAGRRKEILEEFRKEFKDEAKLSFDLV
ncbi:hypothetical protein BDV96DRAFT_568301 [Lophiotrema nucula]|uniref:HD/PDEase domain-containing protein n=1 Tax=Lophiotrema nucula TaxID=690887 RepID=A0A6A5ZJQ6_9PLEO|nr:hypothetical protein BDV96DRAFT_568301 [Lophiotrema nucula]